MLQQAIAFGIVGVAVLAALFHFYKGYVAAPLAGYFLKRGQIKLAMKVRSQIQDSGCGNCKTDSSCH